VAVRVIAINAEESRASCQLIGSSGDPASEMFEAAFDDLQRLSPAALAEFDRYGYPSVEEEEGHPWDDASPLKGTPTIRRLTHPPMPVRSPPSRGNRPPLRRVSKI
jgi:hypothetical protein